MYGTVLISVVGDDLQELVEQLATTIAANQGNWLESSMAHLAGKFAGIVRIDVPAERIDALKAALVTLDGLRVTAESAGNPVAAEGHRRLKLSLVGHDRIGIVREVSQVLARHAVNVEELNTHTASAPMSADILFHASAELTGAATLDALALIADLERLSNDLMVDIQLDESIRR